MKIKAVIFDLDGTLLDTLEDIAISANHVLSCFGKEAKATTEYRYYVGRGAKKLFEELLPHESKEGLQKALELFEAHYEKQYDKHTKAYEGISQVLNYCQAKGIKMAVLSNKPDIFTKKSVNRYFEGWSFQAVLGMREAVPRKPDPSGAKEILEYLHVSAKETLFIGDTKIDMETARNAGLSSVGVLWGFREKEELLAHGAKYLVQTPLELLSLLATIEAV